MAFLLGMIPGIISAVSAAAPAISAVAGGIGAIKGVADFATSFADRKKKEKQQKEQQQQDDAVRKKLQHEEDEVDWLFDREQKKEVDEEVEKLKYGLAHPSPIPGMKEWFDNARKPENIKAWGRNMLAQAKLHPELYNKEAIDKANLMVNGYVPPDIAKNLGIPATAPPSSSTATASTATAAVKHGDGLKMAEHIHKHLMKNFEMNEPATRQLAYELEERKIPKHIKDPLLKMLGVHKRKSTNRHSDHGHQDGEGIRDMLLGLYHKFKPNKKEVIHLLIKLSKEFLEPEVHASLVHLLSHFTSEHHYHGDGLKDLFLSAVKMLGPSKGQIVSFMSDLASKHLPGDVSAPLVNLLHAGLDRTGDYLRDGNGFRRDMWAREHHPDLYVGAVSKVTGKKYKKLLKEDDWPIGVSRELKAEKGQGKASKYWYPDYGLAKGKEHLNDYQIARALARIRADDGDGSYAENLALFRDHVKDTRRENPPDYAQLRSSIKEYGFNKKDFYADGQAKVPGQKKNGEPREPRSDHLNEYRQFVQEKSQDPKYRKTGYYKKTNKKLGHVEGEEYTTPDMEKIGAAWKRYKEKGNGGGERRKLRKRD